jgi:hypothetical protein
MSKRCLLCAFLPCQYKAGRDYTTILEVEGPAGKSRLANVWSVSVK